MNKIYLYRSIAYLILFLSMFYPKLGKVRLGSVQRMVELVDYISEEIVLDELFLYRSIPDPISGKVRLG